MPNSLSGSIAFKTHYVNFDIRIVTNKYYHRMFSVVCIEIRANGWSTMSLQDRNCWAMFFSLTVFSVIMQIFVTDRRIASDYSHVCLMIHCLTYKYFCSSIIFSVHSDTIYNRLLWFFAKLSPKSSQVKLSLREGWVISLK